METRALVRMSLLGQWFFGERCKTLAATNETSRADEIRQERSVRKCQPIRLCITRSNPKSDYNWRLESTLPMEREKSRLSLLMTWTRILGTKSIRSDNWPQRLNPVVIAHRP